jgi:phosphorylcholine metabolism protein LicD
MTKRIFGERPSEEKAKLLYEMKKIEQFFQKTLNLDLYLIYGTLLGAIRNKDFISHDNDVDFAYLSAYEKKKDVLQEFKRIKKILQKNHLLIKAKKNGQIHCSSMSDNFVFDIWTSFIANQRLYLIPSNNSYSSTSIVPFQKIIFLNYEFNIPNDSSSLLNELYYNWQTPMTENYRKFELIKIL